MEISFAQNVAMPLPKWILCGTHGTLTNDGHKSVVRWFDPEGRPAAGGRSTARRRIASTATTTSCRGRSGRSKSHSARTGRSTITSTRCWPAARRCASRPTVVRETMRVLGMIRKSTRRGKKGNRGARRRGERTRRKTESRQCHPERVRSGARRFVTVGTRSICVPNPILRSTSG